MLVTDGSKDIVSSRRDKREILAGEGKIFWRLGSGKTWLKSEVHGRSKEFKV